MNGWTAYHRHAGQFAADIVAEADTLERLQAKLYLREIRWTDIYSADGLTHLQSPRGRAQLRIYNRRKRSAQKS